MGLLGTKAYTVLIVHRSHQRTPTRGTNAYVVKFKIKSHTYRAQICNRTNERIAGVHIVLVKVSMMDSILFTHPEAANMWYHKKKKIY